MHEIARYAVYTALYTGVSVTYGQLCGEDAVSPKKASRNDCRRKYHHDDKNLPLRNIPRLRKRPFRRPKRRKTNTPRRNATKL